MMSMLLQALTGNRVRPGVTRKTIAAARLGGLLALLLLATQTVHGQSTYPPPHEFDFLDSGGAKSEELWTQDWTPGETNALNDYMEDNVGMRKWIEQSARPFFLGTAFNSGTWRLCPLIADGGDWDCASHSTGYCVQDPGCDTRANGAPPPDNYSWVPFLDYEEYRTLSAYDFNFTTVGGVGMHVLARKKGVYPNYNYDLLDEIVDFAHDHGQHASMQSLVYQLSAWIAHTEPASGAQPGDPGTASWLAGLEINHIDAVVGHYASTGLVSRWTVANEAVTPNTPSVTLSDAVLAGDQTWSLTSGDGAILGTIPLPEVTIAGETISGYSSSDKKYDVFALVDDEIVKITARNGDSLTVVRNQAGTQAGHAAGSIVYTIKDLIWPDRQNFQPACETDSDYYLKYWPWRTITDFDNSRANDISDIFLIDAHQHARSHDANAILLYGDGGCVFASDYGQINQKFENVLALERLLKASGAPLDGVGAQLYIPVWACLTADATCVEDGGMRLNPKQLRGVVDSLTAFAKYGVVAVPEMDVRMGIPVQGHDEYTAMGAHVGNNWREAHEPDPNIVIRQNWQGQVYKAELDAALAVPEVYNVVFWGTIDKISWLNGLDQNGWPWYPTYTTVEDSAPCCNGDILGAKYNASTGQLEGHYYRKPAYDGVRAAMDDYFGPAFVVRDPSGKELVRFVENGDVIVLKGPVQENQSSWSGIGTANSFIIKDSIGDTKALVTADGQLYLAGDVHDEQGNLSMPETGTAFIIKNASGDVVSLIDDQGNLKARGKVIVNGVPYILERDNTGDSYSIYS